MAEHQYAQQPNKTDTTVKKQTTPTQTISKMQLLSSHPMAIIQRARINPKSLTHADVMQLQRTIGNRAVGKLLTEIGLIPSTAKPVQRQEIPEQEETCSSCMPRQETPEEEESLQIKRENNTGMPDNLKASVENLSGIDMSDVRVHYNSSKPAEVGALAYAQGTEIHVAPGQEKHLPHEAWHVVQQAQGRVHPTIQMKDGTHVVDNQGLERVEDSTQAINFPRGYKAITDAVQEDGDTFFGHQSEDTFFYPPTVGFTTLPENAKSPDIEFESFKISADEGKESDEEEEEHDEKGEECEDGWYGKIKNFSEFDEGENSSWALKAGDHIVPDYQEKNKPVRVVVSEEIAKGIMDAENEHNEDFDYAADSILSAADNWLQENSESFKIGPVETKEEALSQVENVVNDGLKEEVNLSNVSDFSWANLHSYYGIACKQTRKRDDNKWHTFDVVDDESDDEVTHKIEKGNTQIGNHESEDVINFEEVNLE